MAGLSKASRRHSYRAPACLLVLLTSLMLAGCSPGRRQSGIEAQQGLAAANALYEQGRYAEAADAYAWLEAQGFRNADLNYNLGLAQEAAKPDRIGLAILAHERALRFRPRDPAVRASLSRFRRESGASAPSADGFWAGIERSRTWIGDAELVWSAGILWNLLALIFFARRRSMSRSGSSEPDPTGSRMFGAPSLDRLLRASFVALLIPLTGLGLRSWQQSVQPAAIVVDAETRLLSAPGPASPNAPERPLPSGTLLRVLDEREGYVQITADNASADGWLPASSIAWIDAR